MPVPAVRQNHRGLTLSIRGTWMAIDVLFWMETVSRRRTWLAECSVTRRGFSRRTALDFHSVVEVLDVSSFEPNGDGVVARSGESRRAGADGSSSV